MSISRYLDAINPYSFVGQIPDLEDADSLPYFGETKFDNKKTENKELSWIKGYKENSRLAPFSQLDANPTKKGREGLSKIKSEIPFIRFYKDLDEQTRDEIDRAYNLAVRLGNEGVSALKDVIANAYADAFHLVQDVRATAELMRLQVLQTNGVDITSTDYDGNVERFVASFDVSGDTPWATDHNTAIVTPWENNAAKPLVNLVDAIRNARKYNKTVISEILPSARLYDALLTSPEVKEQLSNIYNLPVDAINLQAITGWINSKTGGNVKILNPYDYNNDAIGFDGTSSVDFVQSDKVLLLPTGKIGSLWHAPTPAEQAKREDARRKVAIADTRTAVASYVNEFSEPIVYQTMVSARFAPSGEGMDRVFTLTVAP